MRFTALVASLLLVAFIVIFYFQASYRRVDFYDRLQTRAFSTARLLIDVDEVDVNLLRVINKNSISLLKEQVVVYNHLNEEIFDSREGDSKYAGFRIDRDTLNKIRLARVMGWERGRQGSSRHHLYRPLQQLCGDRHGLRLLWAG